MSTPQLRIVTVCSRPENMGAVAASFTAHHTRFEIVWNIMFDASRVTEDRASKLMSDLSLLMREGLICHTTAERFSVPENLPGSSPAWSGFLEYALNHFLDHYCKPDAPPVWLWGIDDDNLVHPDFFAGLRELIEGDPSKRCWILGQKLHDSHVRVPEPEHMHPGMIDGGQFVVRSDLVDDLRWPIGYGGDGRFIEALYKLHPNDFGFTQRLLTYYNRLRLFPVV